LRADVQLFSFMVCTSRHDNFGIECGLQRRRGCALWPPVDAPLPSATAGDWPSYKQNAHFEALLHDQDPYRTLALAQFQYYNPIQLWLTSKHATTRRPGSSLPQSKTKHPSRNNYAQNHHIFCGAGSYHIFL
jgi:hypothetical protein